MKRGILCAGVFISCLLGTGIPLGIGLTLLNNRLEALSVSEPPPAKPKAVYPAVLTGKKSIELGDLVLMAMPDAATYSPRSQWHDWDWAAEDDRIAWQPEFSREKHSDFLENEEDEDVRRKGVVRVNVLGAVSTVLRETRQELGWDIALSVPFSPREGAWEILLSPHDCFGVPYENCSFEVVPSLAHAGITADLKLVTRTELGHDYLYLLHHPGKADTLLIDKQRWGTGGDSESISIMDSDEVTAAPDRDAELDIKEQEGGEPYLSDVNKALNVVTGRIPDAKGKTCTLQITVDEMGFLSEIDAFYADNMGALCNAAIEELKPLEWPAPPDNTPVVFTVRVQG